MAFFRRIDPEDIEFMSEVSSASLDVAHNRSHSLLILTFLFFIAAGMWANQATLDEVTRGDGKIVPSSKIQVIQNLEGGILAEVLVVEGEMVDKGQILLKIDDTRFSSSFRETRLKHLELLARSSRLSAESRNHEYTVPKEVINAAPDLARDEETLYQSRQLELKSAIEVLQQQEIQRRQEIVEKRSRQKQLERSYDLVDQEVKMSEPLVDAGVMSEVELLRLRRTANDLQGEIDANRLSIPRIRSMLKEVLEKIEEITARFQTEAARELSDVKAELARTNETIFALEDRVIRTKVRSPVKGTIKLLKINTVGGIIQPGMDLVEIVPIDDTLLVEAKIRPSDIAFLVPGQDAMVKLTAYDFSIYGGLPAKLERISADTITNEKDESFYLIYLRTDKNFIDSKDGPLYIIPGMTTSVDILTGKKTVLDYLLKPILKAKNQALRER